MALRVELSARTLTDWRVNKALGRTPQSRRNRTLSNSACSPTRGQLNAVAEEPKGEDYFRLNGAIYSRTIASLPDSTALSLAFSSATSFSRRSTSGATSLTSTRLWMC